MRSLSKMLPAPIVDKLRTRVRLQRDLRALRNWGRHDEERARFYAQFVTHGDVVFDVGANVGNRSKVFLKLGARVVAFEPQAYCLKVLQEGLGANPALTIEPMGLGAKPGTVEMNISDAHTISSMSSAFVSAALHSGRFGPATWDKKMPVEITTVDAMITRYGKPAFVKIDVEGYELDVMQGMSSPVRALSFEFTPDLGATMNACVDHLVYIGFDRFQLSLGESMTFALHDWVDAESIKQAIGNVPTKEFGDIYAQSGVF